VRSSRAPHTPHDGDRHAKELDTCFTPTHTCFIVTTTDSSRQLGVSRRGFLKLTCALLLARVVALPKRAGAEVATTLAIIGGAVSVARLMMGSGPGIDQLLRRNFDHLHLIARQLQELHSLVVVMQHQLDDLSRAVATIPTEVVDELLNRSVLASTDRLNAEVLPSILAYESNYGLGTSMDVPGFQRQLDRIFQESDTSRSQLMQSSSYAAIPFVVMALQTQLVSWSLRGASDLPAEGIVEVVRNTQRYFRRHVDTEASGSVAQQILGLDAQRRDLELKYSSRQARRSGQAYHWSATCKRYLREIPTERSGFTPAGGVYAFDYVQETYDLAPDVDELPEAFKEAFAELLAFGLAGEQHLPKRVLAEQGTRTTEQQVLNVFRASAPPDCPIGNPTLQRDLDDVNRLAVQGLGLRVFDLVAKLALRDSHDYLSSIEAQGTPPW